VFSNEPLRKIQSNWYQQELQVTEVDIPSACCFSTLGTDGYPNSRFVSLKEIKNNSFIVTGPLNSRKGIEVQASPRVALCFWWPQTGRQVRIQGDAFPLTDADADRYFEGRNRDSKIVSTLFRQGEPIQEPDQLAEQFEQGKRQFGTDKIPRPENWGGFRIEPIRVEFMEFKKSRLHLRELHQKETGTWQVQYLQP
jgi:pyridoxamine 5'-phosphate oxidase